ncbi:PspA/IM30 family protein [Myxococcota bacterium]|nr:PspA/IM30 family protein [Myxococcota bacterium]
MSESLAWVREYFNDAAARAEAERASLERSMRDRLDASDRELARSISEDVAPKIAEAQRLVEARLADAVARERNAREALEKANEKLAEATRKREEGIGKYLRGSLGPAGAGKPLGGVLAAKFTSGRRFTGEVPTEAAYVVGCWAYWVGDGAEHVLRSPLTVEDADRHGDDVTAVIVGFEDAEGKECLGVAARCSMYRSSGDARAVAEAAFRADPRPKAEKHQLYIHSFSRPRTVAQAIREYCSFTWPAVEASGEDLYTWIRDRSLTMVRRRSNVWVFDMREEVDVSSWSDRLTDVHGQLAAAGYSVTKSERRRTGPSDADAHGHGFYLPVSAFPGNTAPLDTTPEDSGASGARPSTPSAPAGGGQGSRPPGRRRR